MANRYKLVSKDYNWWQSTLIGVSKVSSLFQDTPTAMDAAFKVRIHGNGSGEDDKRAVLEIQMPEEEDVVGFDKLENVYLRLTVHINQITAGFFAIGVVELADEFTEATGTGEPAGPAGVCNWVYAKLGIPWKTSDGAVKTRQEDVDKSENVITSFSVTNALSPGTEVWVNLTGHIDMGETKRFCFVSITADGVTPIPCQINFHGRGIVSPDPEDLMLRIWYRDYGTEAFDSAESALTIQPNPNDPTQPLLKWGGVKDADFVNFKVYRSNTPILSVAALTPIATITSPANQEFIDTTALSMNIEYYYMIIAEDANNVGDDATKSTNVTFRRPPLLDTEGDRNANVGQLVEIHIETAIVPASGVKCNKVYIDWGDAVDGYWKEYDVENTDFDLEHIYSSTGPKVINARLQSTLGFWSDLTTICTITVLDLNPNAILIVRPLESVAGESVRCIGSKSQPVASNALISQYDYFVKTAAFPSGQWYLDQGPVFEVVPLSTLASQEILLRITTSTGKIVTQIVGQGETISVISGQPTDLIFSKDTTINSRDESRDSDSQVIGIMDGIGEVELPMNIKNRQYTISGMSGLDDFKADIDKIRLRQEIQEYTRINVYDEKEGITVRLDGRITGYRITQTTRTYVSWSFTFRVFNRTEV